MKKILCFLLLIIITSLTFTACDSNTCQFSRTDYVFGTVVSVSFYGSDMEVVENTVNQCFDELSRLEKIFSANDEESELFTINENASIAPVPVSDEMFSCLETSLKYCNFSAGALDISIGGLVKLWGVGTVQAAVPDEEKIKEYMGVSWKDILLDSDNRTVFFTDSRVKIDLGACAKGYAAAKLAEIAKENNVSGLINLGGGITAVGSKQDNSPFVLGITDPSDTSQLSAYISFSDCSALTSGDYQRYFTEDNIRYHHILDASTGYPAKSDISGITVICADPFAADCLSTAVFVMGSEDGLKLIEDTEDMEAVIIKTNGDIILSSGMDSYDFKKL